MSLVNAEEATRSWESAVDIAAAMIAESRMPAMKPKNPQILPKIRSFNVSPKWTK